jgi:hypothetical protein
MKNEDVKKSDDRKFRFADLLVILFCLSGAVYSINLFRLDLFQTLSAQNETPIGTVTIKINTVQRRMANRVIWDRLIKESPVYTNDTIRVGEISEADLHVGGNDITLNENTLVRLRLNRETGEFQIELTSGNINLVTAAESEKVVLSVMGRQVEAAPGTSLNAAAGNDGMKLQINKGAATIKEENGNRELAAGTMIALDSEGSIRTDPVAAVNQPRPNASYRKNGNELLNVSFSWNRINLQPDDTLRLEIAEDQNFNRIVRTINGLYDSAQTPLDSGLWNWRVTHNGTVLDSGRITVADTEPGLLSPAKNQQFYYDNEPPKVYFQWSGAEDVLHYILEVDVTPEFRNPIIKKQTAVTSFSDSSLGLGVWYWRVTPVFSQTVASGSVSGEANSGTVSHNTAFHIVKGEEPQFITFAPEELAAIPQAAPIVTPAQELPVPAPQPVPVRRQPAPSVQPVVQPTASVQPQQPAAQQPVTSAQTPARADTAAQSPARTDTDMQTPTRTDTAAQTPARTDTAAQTPARTDTAAQTPRELQVTPVSLLPAPGNRLPAAGQNIGIEELKKVNIDFRWSAVAGANAYIFTLYQVTGGSTGGSRRQITQIGPETRTSWTTDVKTLGRGNFVWQVEAVSIGQNGVIERRGTPGENSFVIDIPRPGPVQIISGPGVLP